MERDWELVRLLLIGFSNGNYKDLGALIQLKGKYEPCQINRHALVMWRQHLLLADEKQMDNILRASGKDYRQKYGRDLPVVEFAYDLTWEGHELLALIRDNDVWEQIKRQLGSIECSVPLIQELAKRAILERIAQEENV